jgi:glycosyltransferase involved in cell wall biosynthesis
MNRFRAGLIDRTICVSDSIRKRLVEEYGFSAQKTIAVSNGVDLDHFRVAPRDQGGTGTSPPGPELTIVCVSRMVARKRIADLLEAFAPIAARYPRCRLSIVGSGPEIDRLRARSSELGIDASVEFVGFVEDVRPFLAKGALFVTASENEGLPLSLLQAMASGLPCIATDIPGHRDVIVHGQNGLLVAVKSVPELAAAMEYLLTHEEQRRQLGERGRTTVEQQFDADENMGKIASEVVIGMNNLLQGGDN